MRYKSFEITNFKGIKFARIDIPEDDVTSLALIGLNESGKTTILQAIYSFSPDDESKILFEKDKKPGKPDIEIIPRDKISSFTGSVVVKATLQLDDNDKKDIIKTLHNQNISVDESSLKNEIYVTNTNTYKNGEHEGYRVNWQIGIKVKSGKQRKFRHWNSQEWVHIWKAFKARVPDIAYFPTFVFDLPEKIYLTGHANDPKNSFYKKIFQDVLDYQGTGLTIDQNVVARVRSENFLVQWAEFLSSFWGSSTQQRVTHVMDLASDTITSVIISSWNQIFGDSLSDKKIEIEWKPESGTEDTNAHDIYIKYQVRQGTDRFDISDRSLGFRWFFCFLLFTQFRTYRKGSVGTLFLFDEPASNLHAKAQERLLQSFASISRRPNALIYSTHSHYMINPNWLDQAYIVENAAVDYDKAVDVNSVVRSGNDVRSVKYRQFVNENPGKTTYYQPVLDRLEVTPSMMEIRDGCALVEGKSDYYILRYMADIAKVPNVLVIPAFGSSTMTNLIPLSRALTRKFHILLDSDSAGKEAALAYAKYDLDEGTIVDFSSLTQGSTEPEKALEPEDIEMIRSVIGAEKKPSKKQIMNFFREALASQKSYTFSAGFTGRIAGVLKALSSQ